MNLKTIIPLVVALALAGVAAKLGKDMISKGQSGGPGMKMTKVVVAKDDLPPGATIKDADIVLRDMPTDGLSQNTFNNVADVSGRMVMSQVVKGQIVLEGFLAPKGVTGAQAMVPQGMRAVSLEVNEFSGVAGLLSPGSHVDLVQTIQTKDDKAGPMAKTIVENLRVIAVGRRLGNTPANPNDADAQPARSVTVLATAEQAETIDLASHVGSPRLVLRNTLDGKINSGKGITVAELRGAEEPETKKLNGIMAELLLGGPTTKPVEPKVAVIKPAEPNFREVEVIRAGASTNVRMNVPKNESISGTADKLQDESQD
jgi:pilus assembly protein CpaB